MASRICSSQNEVDDLLAKLKVTPCPHCKVVGALVKHGFLLGYDQNHQRNKAIRAARVYCSNRHRARGCGRTFSVWIADKVKRLFLSADNLWVFLTGAVSLGNKLQAFRDLQSDLSDSAPYHLWRRFLKAQAAIRTALTALCQPPQIVSSCPAMLTLAHLSKAFQEHLLTPVAAFGVTLQTFFL